MQVLKSCYTSSSPLHIENEGAGEGGDRKDMQILWHKDLQGTSRLWSRKVTVRVSTNKVNIIFVWGVINIPLPKPHGAQVEVPTKGGHHNKLGTLSFLQSW